MQKAPETKRSRGFKATPQGLEEPPIYTGNSDILPGGGGTGGDIHAAIAAFSSLSDLTALWPYLDDQQRDTVLDVAQALAKANVSTPSTVDTSAQTPVKPR